MEIRCRTMMKHVKNAEHKNTKIKKINIWIRKKTKVKMFMSDTLRPKSADWAR